MTPPIPIGSEVIITGPSLTKDTCHTGEKITIDQIYLSGRSGESWYSKRGYPGYPASSLQLVEELKIGDWAEIIGPSRHGFSEAHGVIFKIEHVLGHEYSAPGVAWYQAKCLRKLTPEEIAMHTGYKMQDFQAVTSKGMAALGKLLAPIVETHVADAIKRLSAIEKRLDGHEAAIVGVRRSHMAAEGKLDGMTGVIRSHNNRISAIESRLLELNLLGPSHAELLGDVEALAEKVGAIEKRIDDGVGWEIKFNAKQDAHTVALEALGQMCDALKESVDCLEAYQKGEMPEVAYRLQTEIPVGARFSVEKMLNGSVSLTYSDCGIELAQKVLDGMREA